MQLPNIDNTWTLFLDRDGVINKLIPNEYIETWQQFEFLPGVLDSFPALAKKFGRIIIVTNQQGVGKGIMTAATLEEIHEKMHNAVTEANGRIDGIYQCTHLANAGCECRKPKPGLAREAQEDHHKIDFSKSIIVGDSDGEVQMGKELGMFTILLPSVLEQSSQPDLRLNSLADLVEVLSEQTA